MDKEEFKAKIDEMKELVNQKNYNAASVIVDSIDWKRVKNVRTLCMVGDILAANKRYKESRNIFLMAYRRSSVGKTILYRMVDISIKLGNLDEALDYYTDFVNVAPNDNNRFILKYKIYSARKAPIEQKIQILEDYKEKEFTERWSYELAKLYYDAGEKQKCIDISDDLTLWFHDGKYVVKSLELKEKFTLLTPSQKKVCEEYYNQIETSDVIDLQEKQEEESKQEEVIHEDKEQKFLEEPELPKILEVESLMNSISSIYAPLFDEGDEFQKKVSEGIKDIFQNNKSSDQFSSGEDQEEKQIDGQINIADVIPEITEEEKKDIPSLEPEEFDVHNIPKLNVPKVDFQESTKIEDIVPTDDFTINLEDTILAAAAAQGIEVPDNIEIPVEEELTIEEDLTKEDHQNQDDGLINQVANYELANTQEFSDISEIEKFLSSVPDEEFSEEEELMELMKFIDEQNSDPNIGENDIVPREDILDDEEIKLFKYFSYVPGMKEQILETLKDVQMAASDKTSNEGNIIIMGNRGCGKTVLADLLMKAICRELKMTAAKTAKVDAAQLSGQNIAKIVDKLSGGFLLIQNVNQMDADTVAELSKAMEFRTDGLTVILEDEKIVMRKFIAKNPKFVAKFTSTISIPVFTNDELVNFAKIYTNEKGYVIDDMAILALYTQISDNQKEDEPMTVDGVRILIDNAIAKEEGGIRKLQRNLSRNRTDRDGFIILYEKDFK